MCVDWMYTVVHAHNTLSRSAELSLLVFAFV